MLAHLYDIDEPSFVEDKSTNSYQQVEVVSSQATYAASSNTYSISLTDTDSWYDLSDAKLKVELKIHSTGTTPAVANDQICLQSPWNLFSNVSLDLNSSNIASISDPGHLANIRKLVEGGEKYQKSIQDKEYYYPLEVADGGVDHAVRTTTPKSIAAACDFAMGSAKSRVDKFTYDGTNFAENALYEDNFKNQNVRSIETKSYCFLPLKDLFPLLGVQRVMRGSRVDIKLTRGSDLEALFGTASTNNVLITKIDLWLPKVVPSLEYEKKLNSILASGKAMKEGYEHMVVNKIANLADTVLSNSVRITTESARISRVYVAFRLSNKGSSMLLNPLQYEELNVNKLHIRVNGVPFPLQEYNMSNGDKIRVLDDIHGITGKKYDDSEDSMVNYKNWSTTRCVYAIDCSALNSDSFDAGRTNNLEVRYEMSSAPASAYDVFILVVNERKIDIELAQGKMAFRQR